MIFNPIDFISELFPAAFVPKSNIPFESLELKQISFGTYGISVRIRSIIGCLRDLNSRQLFS